MSPAVRKLVLTAHIAISVGWLGSVVAFLALAIVGLVSDDQDTVRGVYLVMEPAAWWTLIPLSIASLVVGVVQSLGTPWGLLRHYWVVFKLLINVVSVVVLVTYMETFELMADLARPRSGPLSDVRTESPVLHATAALILLVVATILSVYKPRGLTPAGQRSSSKVEPSRAAALDVS